MSTLFVRAKVAQEDVFIRFNIEDADARKLVADAKGVTTGRVAIATKIATPNEPAWFRNASSTETREVKLTME